MSASLADSGQALLLGPLIVLAGTYLAFVFFGESFRPFTRPSAPLVRRRWRYGRRMALYALLAGALVATGSFVFAIPVAWASLLFVVLFAPPASVTMMRHHARHEFSR